MSTPHTVSRYESTRRAHERANHAMSDDERLKKLLSPHPPTIYVAEKGLLNKQISAAALVRDQDFRFGEEEVPAVFRLRLVWANLVRVKPGARLIAKDREGKDAWCLYKGNSTLARLEGNSMFGREIEDPAPVVVPDADVQLLVLQRQ